MADGLTNAVPDAPVEAIDEADNSIGARDGRRRR